MILLVGLLVLALTAFLIAAKQASGMKQRPPMAQALGLGFLTAGVVAFVLHGPRSGDVPVSFTFTGTGVATGLSPPLTTTTTTPPIPAGATDFGGFRPHFQGFGAMTRGGRGGPVCKVSTLTIGGVPTFGTTGDLADCVSARPGCVDTWETCARVVVFTVSGTSNGGGQLSITSPFLTIAGATAPQGGFTLDNTRLLVDTHDVYVGHLRVRHPPQSLNACSIGDAGDGGDNSHVQNVIFDHVTCSWANQVNNFLQAGPGSSNVMLTNSLIYEGLWPSAAGGIGVGVGGDATVVRNVFAHHWSRQPIWGSPARLILANNVTYNGTDNTSSMDTLPAFFGDADGDGSTPSVSEAMILWNVIIPGPNSGTPRAFLGLSKKSGSVSAGSKIFLEGNSGPGVSGGRGDGQWAATVCGNYGAQYQNAATCGPASNIRTNTPFPWWMGFNMATLTSNVRDAVLANAGARPKDRDAADVRVLADVVERDGTHYLDWNYIQTHYGGMPTIPSVTRDVTLPANPNADGTCGTYADGTARSRLDCFLETDSAFGMQRLEN